ncbi:DUF885 family protein [Zeaxanthinibacter enoshimensis]|uniref:Uncharacterized protein DUF885 n=1 Tax=Zeaxanthinibacter enoshimensis TaxID=392009 RepID=A0A4R6TR65_9FLAO|nr:DUF885 family protein [Zeaxanthinibacter enoshimensis]TDQ32996.1 uncharacterized protein DUF885 [Zeaxanthinibacter enoshimensis]
MKHLLFALGFLVTIGYHNLRAQQDSESTGHVTELYQLATEFRADQGSLSRFYAIENSPERRERFRKFYEDYLAKLQEYKFDSLSRGGQVDYLMIKKYLHQQIRELNTEKNEYEKLRDWISPGEELYTLEKLRRRGKRLDGQEVAGILNNITNDFSAASERVKEQQPLFTRQLTSRAKGILEGQRAALQSMFGFYEGYDPQFTWWVTQPYKVLDSVLLIYAATLESRVDPATLPEDDGSGIIGDPIGRDAILQQLAFELIPYTPEELIAIAEKEFAWCDRELLKASREMGFGDDWKAAQEKVKQTYVPVGQQPEAMLELYDQSIAFLKEKDLLTIPPLAEETWRMTMLSPERQLIAPFFLGGEVLQIAYPTDAMNHEEKLMSMRGNNPHFNRSTVHHELIAGHHLQGFVNNRNKPYRFYRTPFWTEGWALYWELLLWDLDFPRSPEDRIGMLFWRMHRCARIIFSLNYHLGNWTPQECIDYLVNRVGHERANAAGEVRRSFTGGYGPLYQIAYMIGGLQFYALKEELVDSGQMTYKEYHDAVMKENSMPVEIVRALLTSKKLNKDFSSEWKFYED